MTRTRLLLAALASTFLFSAKPQTVTSREANTDRPGGDYRNFDLSRPDPSLCAEVCMREGECKAFVYVKPGVQAQAARCWLKTLVAAARPDNCCVSGVKTASTVFAKLSQEPSTDRPGNDYRNFDLSRPDPSLCLEECARDAKCKSFTYVKPGTQGQAARCWLKDSVPAARTDDCCTSGVKPE